MNFRRFLLSSAALALVAGAQTAQAQTSALRGDTIDANAPAGYSPTVLADGSPVGPLTSGAVGPPTSGLPVSRIPARTNLPNPAGPPAPEFLWNASVNFSESYVTNADGVAGESHPDYLSNLGFDSDLHEHSRRISLDANYSLLTSFYAKGTVPTQVINNLQLLGDVDVIPEYLDLDMRAFAQPVVTTNFGVISEGGREIPGSFLNAYGYYATPDLKLNWGEIATFKTMPSYGQVFFTNPAGTTAANTIPGIGAAVDSTVRSLTEQVASGADFTRLKWNLTGQFSETDQGRDLLSEKSGIADGRFALDSEWSLLATGGYDSIRDTIPLLRNVSGPVALGGIGLTLGKDFSFELEAGERYNSLSFDGNLRYDLTSTGTLTASANDYVETPEGQLLNNLASLTALPNGMLASTADVLANGTIAIAAPFSVQSLGNPSLNQFISRYQTVDVSFAQTFERTSASATLFGIRRTFLTPGFVGRPTADSWGAQLSASRSINPLLTATLSGTYFYDQEFGGLNSTISLEGALEYSLSRETHIFLRSDYIDRLSSKSLQALSPLAGDVSDFRITLGISHAL